MAANPAKKTQDITPFYVMELLRRAKQLEDQGRSIIHMEIGEPDFPTPQAIIDAGIRLLQSGEVKYTPTAGLPRLRQEIADFYRCQGISVPMERIFITPGASGALLLALGSSLNAGDNVLLADPCYPCNRNFVTLLDGRVQAIPVDATTRYHLNAALIRQHWTDSSKGVLIASPANPTGTLIEEVDLRQSVAMVNDLRGCFYSDEIYHGLVYDKAAVSALKFSDQVFVINSFSKYFGMTGWRIGWLVVPEQFMDVAERLAQNLFIATSTTAQYAAIAAFATETQIELERRRVELAMRRDFLYEGLLRLGFDIPIKPEGAFYIYANVAAFTDNSWQFALDLLEEEGVAVTPGKDFGEYHADYSLRFAYTLPIDKMSVALQRLQRFINRK